MLAFNIAYTLEFVKGHLQQGEGRGELEKLTLNKREPCDRYESWSLTQPAWPRQSEPARPSDRMSGAGAERGHTRQRARIEPCSARFNTDSDSSQIHRRSGRLPEGRDRRVE